MRALVALAAGVVALVAVSQPRAEPPLVGVAYARWGVENCDTFGTTILLTYEQEAVRRKVRLQLAAMHAAGLASLRLMIWHSTRADPHGTVASQGGRLVEPFRTNLIRYLGDVRAAGFGSLTVDFAPQGPNDPIGAPVDEYDPPLFEQNWSFIRDVRPLVKRYGPATTRVDLLSEGAPSDYWPYRARLMGYLTEMYRRYADAFGTDDVTVSSIAPPEPFADMSRPEGGRRLQNLIDALRASGRPLPGVWPVHVSNWWGPSGAATLYGLRQVDQTLQLNGLPQPLVIGETIYEDRELAAAIAEFRRTSTRPILEVQEWPLERGSTCRDFSAAPPYRADAYIEALTGQPPDTTLRATVARNGVVALSAPYGGRATALIAGRYRLLVTDASARVGFALAGAQTGARTTGAFEFTLDLRPGTYRFGAGATLLGRLVVL